jgi:hypothetical protein
MSTEQRRMVASRNRMTISWDYLGNRTDRAGTDTEVAFIESTEKDKSSAFD